MRLLVLSGAAVALVGAALIATSQSACSSDDNPVTPAPADAGQEAAPAPPVLTEEQFKAQAQRSMTTITVRQLDFLSAAATELQGAIPAVDRAWDVAGADAAKVAAMQAAWKKAHVAWEHVEPMLAGQYAAQTLAINARYEQAGVPSDGGATTADTNLFDDTGFTGIHAIERILFPSPQSVSTEEAKLTGYKVAAPPANATEAADFGKLVAKLIADVKALTDTYKATPVDLKYAFSRVTSFMEQLRTILVETAEKRERSRYSQQTLLDLQAALEGTQLSYKIFQPWLLQGHVAPQDPTKHGPAHDKPIQAGFGDLIAAFTAPAGPNIPPAPADWNGLAPTEDHLKKDPFGKLWAATIPTNDPNRPGSVVSELKIVATILGLNP